jgi:hypothetical protein
MPVKLRVQKMRAHRITEQAINAFQAEDFSALHLALGLKPWEESPLHVDVEADPPGWMWATAAEDFRQAQALRRELEAACGAG